MRIGILKGKVEGGKGLQSYKKRGWALNCHPRLKVEGNCERRDYAYGRCVMKKGMNVVGVLVDFTVGKLGRVNFVVNGVDGGVAFDNVEPPVSPAFTLCRSGDYVEVMKNYSVPTCYQ